MKEGNQDLLELGGWEGQQFRLSPKTEAPEGMVHVPESSVGRLPIARLGMVDLQGLPGFWIDRYEVMNRQFKEFVDQGGYRDKRYWKHPFRKGNQVLSWEEAMRGFLDTTGRPGPATWEGGTYPAGANNLPVGGVSWYEAAAYAEFAGKQLPTIHHWYRAADPRTAPWVVPKSDFKGPCPAPVGQYKAPSPSMAYDMAGNVREWCFNEAGGGFRFTLGGACQDPTYTFAMPDARPPLNRDQRNGLRCVRYIVQPAAPLLSQRPQEQFPLPTPVADDAFRSYLALFSYEPKNLNSRTIEVDRSDPEWVKERVSFEAAYSEEQVPGVLLCPKNGNPPFQVVIYSPTASAQRLTSTQSLEGRGRWDYVVRNGRAVFHPVFFNTYGRTKTRPKTPLAPLTALVERGQDLRRAVDYLLTRRDIDGERVAYLGGSAGAGWGPVMLAIEPRFKVAVLQDGGFFAAPALQETNGVNYAPRVRVPVLMINGRYDYFFPLEESQTPLFNLLGTPAAQKRRVLLEASHDVSIEFRQTVMRETLDWLDKYLGPVQTK